MHFKIIFFYLTVFLLSGCATHGPGSAARDSLPENSSLVGKWQSACRPYKVADSKRRQILIKSNKLLLSETIFRGKNCNSDMSMTLAFEGTYSIQAASNTDGIRNIDVIYKPGTISLSIEMEAFMKSKGATLDSFARSNGYRLTNIPISEIGYESYENYSIFRVDGNQLRVGGTTKLKNASTPETRPTELHKTAIYRRLSI